MYLPLYSYAIATPLISFINFLVIKVCHQLINLNGFDLYNLSILNSTSHINATSSHRKTANLQAKKSYIKITWTFADRLRSEGPPYV